MKFDNFKVRFGKYKGKLISWIVENDPNYAKWLATQSNSTTKTKRAAQSILDKIKEGQYYEVEGIGWFVKRNGKEELIKCTNKLK